MRRLIDAARAGDIDTATRCELAVLAYRGGSASPLVMAGAALRAWHREDTRVMAHGKVWAGRGEEE